MNRYPLAFATLILLVAPLSASAYGYTPMYQPAYSYPNDPRYSMYNVQLGAQALSLQNQRYYIGSDCTDYGYGDCAQRLVNSGSQYGPGWMVTNPQPTYGGGGYGYNQYGNSQPAYYGGYGYGNNQPSYYGGQGYGNSYYGGYNSYSGYNPYRSYYGY